MEKGDGICDNGRQGTHFKNQVVSTTGIAEGRLDELYFSQGGIKDHGSLKNIFWEYIGTFDVLMDVLCYDLET